MDSRFVPAAVVAATLLAPVFLLVPADGWSRDVMEVFTRKRKENLQDVPISVSAIVATDIERKGIQDIAGVAKYTPGVNFDEGFGGQDNRIVIRGLSPTRGRANAAFLVDGIDFTGEAISTAGQAFSINQRLIDVERIEVVKGPQSALYGRSAFAGAIQYITKNPNLENWEGDIAADIGSEEQYQLTGAVGGPIAGGFGLRLNALTYDRAGFYNNSFTGGEVGGSDGAGAALTGLWEATENLSIKARLAYSEDNFQTGAQARVAPNTIVNLEPASLIYTSGAGGPFFPRANYPDCGPFPTSADNALTSCLGTPKVLAAGTAPQADQAVIAQSPDPATGGDYKGTELDLITFTMLIDWDSSIGRWSSYTGLSQSEATQKFDGLWDAMTAGSYTSLDQSWTVNRIPCPTVNTVPGGMQNCSPIGQQIDFSNDTDLFSQEFRYSSQFDGPVNFTVGLNYWYEKAEQTERSMTFSSAYFRGFPPGPPRDIGFPNAAEVLLDGDGNGLNRNPGFSSRETQHGSLYGLIDWDISDAWKLTLEGRYVDEEITNVGDTCNAVATQAQSGLASTDTDGDGTVDACNGAFRGGSSLAQASGGTLADGTYTNAVVGPLEAKFSESFFVPKGTLEWRSSDTKMWYFSIAQGQKPGGISSITGGTFFDPQNNTYDAEKLLAYELGGKTTWADGAVVVNGAIFFQDYTDKQVGVTQFDARTQTDVSSIENAGEAEIFGIEFDASWAINENWFTSVSYTWLDTEYTKFESLTGSSTEAARTQLAGNGGCLELVDLNPDPAVFDNVCRVSRKGNKIEDIPEHSLVGYLKWETPIGRSDMNMFVDTNVIYNDERFIEENNIKLLDSYWLMDLRAGVVTNNWEVVLFVDNVTDDDTPKSAVDVGSQLETFRQGLFPPGPNDGMIVSLPSPRIYGIRASFGFGR
ncbi:MAG: TonB-dependent receptor [Gammaproteobacteria bacterium]